MQTEKETAVDFLKMVIAGDIELAYTRYVNMHGKHHNVYFPAGFSVLKQAMMDNHGQFPTKQLNVGHVLGDGDMVAVHSNLVFKQGEPGMVVVHIFCFEEGKIIEMWDMGQEIPADSPNTDGVM
jgi:predicted SnoaL-like aldol condensation-catalyzing enzyme